MENRRLCPRTVSCSASVEQPLVAMLWSLLSAFIEGKANVTF